MDSNNKNIDADKLRKRAKELLNKNKLRSYSKLSDGEVLKLIHELEVHQIELELQNEELLLARVDAQESYEKYVDLYEFAPSGYFTLSKDGEIIETNLTAAKMLGKERVKLINRKLGIFVSNDTRPVFKLFLGKLFISKNKSNCEVTLSNGDVIPKYVYLTGIVTNQKNQCFVSMVDISEMKRIEIELRIAKRKAEESDKLKSAFLANISHEIRTPMSGILGFAGLLKDSNLTGEEKDKFIEMIEKSGMRMLSIINNLMDISKLESGTASANYTLTNINEQIELVSSFFETEIKKKQMKHNYNCELANRDAVIRTDGEKVYAILTNLLKNAIKYSDKGKIQFGYKIKGKYIEYYVKDEGIGISDNMKETVFERFVQADASDKRSIQGIGLGLSISKAFVEILGGRIWVDSKVGKGSTFYFTIPYDAAPIEGIVNDIFEPSGKVEKFSENFITLIAEDDKSWGILLKKMITPLCKDILYSQDGIDAVKKCKSNPNISLVLMDLRMPGIDGFEAVKQIRDFNKDIIIIAQTAFGFSADRDKAIDAGCNDYILKPFTRNSLKLLVNKHISDSK